MNKEERKRIILNRLMTSGFIDAVEKNYNIKDKRIIQNIILEGIDKFAVYLKFIKPEDSVIIELVSNTDNFYKQLMIDEKGQMQLSQACIAIPTKDNYGNTICNEPGVLLVNKTLNNPMKTEVMPKIYSRNFTYMSNIIVNLNGTVSDCRILTFVCDNNDSEFKPLRVKINDII